MIRRLNLTVILALLALRIPAAQVPPGKAVGGVVASPPRAIHAPKLKFFGDNLQDAVLKLTSSPGFSLTDPSDLNDLGYVYLYFGQYEEATSQFSKILATFPKYAPAQMNLGVTAYRMGDNATAITWLRRALKTDPANGDAAFDLGVLALEGGDLEGAVQDLGKAVQALPKEPEAWNNLGCAHYRLGRTADALNDFRKAWDLGGQYTEAALNLGAAALAQGDASTAREAGERAVRLTPDGSAGYGLLGAAWLAQGQPEKSVLAFARSVQLDPSSAGAFNNLGRAQMALDHEAEAERAFQKALALDPGLLSAQWNLADLRLKQGRSNEALPLYEKAQAAPGADRSAVFQTNWGTACAKTGDAVKARRLWEEALQLDPQELTALYDLALQARDQKESGRAREWARRGQALAPQDSRWERLLGDLDRMDDKAADSLKHYRQAQKLGDHSPDLDRRIESLQSGNPLPAVPGVLDSDQTPENVHRSVQALWDLGETEEALSLAVGAANRWPKDALALKTLSEAHRALGDEAESGAAMEKAVQLQPSDPKLRVEAGNLAFDQNRFTDAENHFQAALRLDPGSLPACLGYGSSLFKQYKVEEALAAWKKGQAAHPDSAELCYNLARGDQELGRRAQARLYLDRALKIRPNYPEAITNGAAMDLDEDQLDAAEKKLKRSLDLDPAQAETHFNFGNLNLKRGRFDEAVAEYRKGLQVHPDDADGYYYEGVAFLRQSKWAPAQEAFEKALEKNPHHADALYNLGKVAVETGQNGAALKYFQESLDLKPYQSDALFGMGLMRFKMGQYEEAATQFKRAQEDWKVGCESAYYLGRTYEKLGDPGSAEMSYRRSLRGCPDFGPTHLFLGDLLASRGRTSEARAEYQSAAAQTEYPEVAKMGRDRLAGK